MLEFVKTLPRPVKQSILLLIDILLVPAAFLAADLLVRGPAAPWDTLHLIALPLVTALAGLVSVLLGLPRIQLKSYEISAMGRNAVLAAVLATVMLMLDLALGAPVPVSVIVVFGLVYLFLGAFSRLMLLQALLYIYRRDVPATRVLIYGAGKTGIQLAMALKPHEAIRAIAFVDDNPVLHGLSVAGLTVHPARRIKALIEQEGIERVLLAMPSISRPRQNQIARKIVRYGVEVQLLPSFAQLIGQEAIVDALAPALPSAFLGRPALDGALDDIARTYAGKTVMITGAGGSIGSELCRQILNCRPASLILLENSEFALFSIERELSAIANGGDCRIVPVLGSTGDARMVRATIDEHGVQVILHAAAYKHVPLVESNPESGVANNLFGTQTVAQIAAEAGIERFILISSDKAVRPHGVMGATKRLAEIVVCDQARRSQDTVLAAVRFGNVLGSSGSVLPQFQDQILQGGPVTLTDERVTRYFMTIQEATQLVLRAGAMAQGGEIFVLDMGRPVQIAELARNVIEAAGYSVRDAANPEGDIEIVTTGLRPGEKLHEELSITGSLEPTDHPKLLCAREHILSEFEIARAMQSLSTLLQSGDRPRLVAETRRWVRRDLELNEPTADTGEIPS